uniref:Uncharacterized protein n=1 Tax=Molossus molossus TaxID=27622 RepID=A0A7J8JVF9_MOLMO|nr:hypothetical protein HJG59_007921 [Molossus molossus]
MVTALLSPHKENKTGFEPHPHPRHMSTFRASIRFYLGPAVWLGIDHLVDLIPDESLAASLILSPPVISLNKFKSVLSSSRGTIFYLLLYKSALVPSTSFTLSQTHNFNVVFLFFFVNNVHTVNFLLKEICFDVLAKVL